MKISIDIDCTPEEARAFLGLPNVEPMQDALVAKMQERLTGYIDAMDPEALMRVWLPSGLKGFGELQERFWNQFMSGMTGGGAGDRPGRDDKNK